MSHIPPISLKVASTLAAYRGVAPVQGTPETVAYPASAAVKPIGITADTVLETGAAIPINIGGIGLLEMAAAITAGADIAFNSTGMGVKHTDVTAGSWIIGTLLQNCVTGTIARILIQPTFKSIP